MVRVVNAREIADISEAEDLLKEAETSFPSARSAALFSEAIDTLNAYVHEEEPDDEILNFISNLKYSYTRRVLSRLQEIQTQQVDVLFPYLLALLRAQKEFDALRLSHPDIGEAFEKCMERFRPQLEEIIRGLQQKS